MKGRPHHCMELTHVFQLALIYTTATSQNVNKVLFTNLQTVGVLQVHLVKGGCDL